MSDKKFDLEERVINFAVMIIDIIELLPNTRVGNHVGGQLIKSGTSPAPNYGEAMGAESRNDFIHKIKIGLKELRESRVWLIIINKKKLIKPPKLASEVLNECNELIGSFQKVHQRPKRTGAKRIEY
ncbi:four helix bundle protein [Planctomycetota bacterium]